MAVAALTWPANGDLWQLLKTSGITGELKEEQLSSFIALAISFCLMPELSTPQASSDYRPSSRCVEPVVFVYSSDLNRP
jgi:hypothetical protein